MNCHNFSFCDAALKAMPSGALWWPAEELLCVSDLHLGKSERVARRSGQSLPPYETRDTLTRLGSDLDATNARKVICLGDSFDDLTAAQSLSEDERLWIARLQAGRHWIWIEGNHDPGPVEFAGEHLQQLTLQSLTFRHIAETCGQGEVSGHYHPKVRVATRGRLISRPAFLVDAARLILPAYGTYTGGLTSDAARLSQIMQPKALAILTGPRPTCVPMPR
ncbi:ligase-associated DNA damage response endonuclease PdeM [Roseobacter weihaiensis]|uniref:ligase-associated DNA damage response endonuclease PdeM n=1 Tax=Roseobacter weihaiensis TaxID=2763262 RepID=UPI001D09B81C|nr:ligase-associated DNA damage response endonuclease PdeM [Roseobacter sp. H9]